MPIIAAWSTPGAALIAATDGSISFPEAVGCYVAVAALILLTAFVKPLTRLIEKLPAAVAAGMLSGVLIKFVIAVFDQAALDPMLVVPLVLLFLVLRMISPAWAVVAILLLGIGLVFGLGKAGPLPDRIGLSTLEFVTPHFTLGSLIGLAIPLYLVTMASQNLPGFAVLKAAGYTPAMRPVLAVTGIASLATGLFGAVTTNLAAITAAICTGPGHPPGRRQALAVRSRLCGLLHCLGRHRGLAGGLVRGVAGLSYRHDRRPGAAGPAGRRGGRRAAGGSDPRRRRADALRHRLGPERLRRGLGLLGSVRRSAGARPCQDGDRVEKNAVTEFSEIPVLDLSPLMVGGDSAELARAFAKAYGETGFAYVINHGIDPALRTAIFDASKRFHALPEDTKQTIALDWNHRGYIAINTSTDVNSDLAEVTKPNQSASFMMMREDDEADPDIYLSGPNQWPDLPGFREACETYAEAMSRLGRKLMGLALDAIGVEDRGILNAFDTPTIWLRLLHYPPQPPQAPDDLYGSAPHKDFGCLTLLAQDDVGGLQVQTPAGNWVDAPPMADAFVVNVGDMLHRMSNGKLLSTPHRVINTTGKERFSVPFFFDPHVSTEIAPLPGTGAPRLDQLTFDQFLRGELEAAYDAHNATAADR